jgi:hypothetical protein
MLYRLINLHVRARVDVPDRLPYQLVLYRILQQQHQQAWEDLEAGLEDECLVAVEEVERAYSTTTT